MIRILGQLSGARGAEVLERLRDETSTAWIVSTLKEELQRQVTTDQEATTPTPMADGDEEEDGEEEEEEEDDEQIKDELQEHNPVAYPDTDEPKGGLLQHPNHRGLTESSTSSARGR